MLFFALLDQGCKYAATHGMLGKDASTWVDAVYVPNAGIALSIPLPLPLTILFSVVSISLFFIIFLRTRTPGMRIALIALLLGALSNFIDRVTLHQVTDYLVFFSRSAINIADILIVGGLLGIAWYYRHVR